MVAKVTHAKRVMQGCGSSESILTGIMAYAYGYKITLQKSPQHTLDWDRYKYVRSNPIRYVDPTGNEICIDEVIAGRCYVDYHLYQFGIRTYGFSQAEKWAIYSSAMAKAEKYVRPEESLANAYKRIMGDITYLVNENSPMYSLFQQNPPNGMGIALGILLTASGGAMFSIAVGVIPHDPPVGLLLASASVTLIAIGAEVIYHSLGDLRPPSWPDSLLNIDGLK